MKRKQRVGIFPILGTVALAIAGCSGISYNHDFDPQFDFSRFETYVWAQPKDQSATGQRGVDELTEKRIIAAVDRELENKGYRKISSGQPDFVVNFYVTTQDKIDVSTYYTGWGYYGWYGGTQTYVTQWTEGTLVIDFIETAENDLAWRGWARGAVEPNLTPERRTEAINEVVAGILKRFPPS